jgi:UDP-glucose 4-epimerase
MRVLVTGGAGFIGSHVVDRLVATGITPRIFDVRPSAHHPAGEVDAVRGDLLDREALQKAMRGCDAVVHLAAAADVDDVAQRPAEAEAVNARGTLNVLEAARGAGVAQVVYASTIWVYGSATGAVDEDHAVELPDHLYTATKLAGEMYCRSYAALYGLECTVLRFGIPYGPRARPAGVIPIFVRKALAGEPLTIAGEGLQSRRFVYVEDLAEGVVRSLVPLAIGRTYNLVGEESVTVRGIADTVRDLVGDVDIVHTPARTADFAGAEVSGARAAAELGWRPVTSFGEGARRYFEWHCLDAAAHPTAPVARVARVARARRRPQMTPGFVSLVLSWLTVFAVAGVLAAYLGAVHAVGLAPRDEHTVGVLSIAALAAYLAVVLDSGRRGEQVAIFVGWAVAAAAVVTVLMPELREIGGLTTPDLTLVLLSAVGGSLAIGIADAGLRLRRTGEDRLAADRA